jgi:undecaprenyl-diphosphatase
MSGIALWQAAALGALEGFTEFLPISSTGHLILACRLLRLQGEAVKTFEVVIQAGAVLAVVGLYRRRVAAMWQGLLGRDRDGRRLLRHLCLSFAPAAVAGLLLHEAIKGELFQIWPVVWALAAGGALMLGVDRWQRLGGGGARAIEQLRAGEALAIGVAQCVALWPGMSRAMVTLVAGLCLGLRPAAAAEYSFLLALPTLGAATLFDLATGGAALLEQVGLASVLLGFVTAGIVAALAIRGFLAYLAARGLALFGWYRLGLAALIVGIRAGA